MTDIIDKVAGTIIKDRKILMVRNRGKSYFINPGGKRERKPDGSMESDLEVLHRELLEELGVEVVLGNTVYDGAFQAPAANKTDGTEVRDRCYRFDFHGEPQARSEVEEIRWMTTADAADTTATGRLIFAYYNKLGLID